MPKAKEFFDKRLLFTTSVMTERLQTMCYCYMSHDPLQSAKHKKDFDLCETQYYLSKIWRNQQGRIVIRMLMNCDFKVKTMTDAGLQAILPNAFRKWHAALKTHLKSKN
jgi:hypothetical protein